MLEQLIIILLVLIISFYVSYPFFFEVRSSISNTERNFSPELLEKLIEQKSLYLSEIKDIEFDYGLGKLNEQDYKELLQKYKFKAAAIIEKIENIEESKNLKDIDDQIEREILAFRKLKS